MNIKASWLTFSQSNAQHGKLRIWLVKKSVRFFRSWLSPGRQTRGALFPWWLFVFLLNYIYTVQDLNNFIILCEETNDVIAATRSKIKKYGPQHLPVRIKNLNHWCSHVQPLVPACSTHCHHSSAVVVYTKSDLQKQTRRLDSVALTGSKDSTDAVTRLVVTRVKCRTHSECCPCMHTLAPYFDPFHRLLLFKKCFITYCNCVRSLSPNKLTIKPVLY